MSSPSRREVALASEDDTRGLADPPFQLWYETTFSSSLSTLNCSCTFCRRRLWHSVSGHCFPDQVRAVLDEPDPARSSFLIWSCPNVEFFFLLCIFHHRRSHLVFVAGEAVLSPNLHGCPFCENTKKATKNPTARPTKGTRRATVPPKPPLKAHMHIVTHLVLSLIHI